MFSLVGAACAGTLANSATSVATKPAISHVPLAIPQPSTIPAMGYSPLSVID
jgi:hypothetical protein